jgi:UDP-N-acetyl-D-glucosamine dehydrogenase
MKTSVIKSVAVLGLGYVGLPLACLLAKKGYTVYGIDIDKHKVDPVNQGKSHIEDDILKQEVAEVKGKIIATTSDENLTKSDAVVICVPTPVDEKYNPDFGPVISATNSCLKHLHRGQLIILESTVSPGTCEEVMLPVLDKSGLKAGIDYDLSHCPERIDPGNKKYRIKNLPRVVGSLTPEGLKRTAEFYESFIEAPIAQLSSLKAAEAAKIIENSFRDVNIAFVNELAKSFDRMGIDILEVIRGASTKFSFMPHYPGCGVGGHCISVDPYYLIERAKEVGFDHKFLRLAREINNSMPSYTVSKLIEALNDVGMSVRGTKITVLGVAYKQNVDDMRESPAFKVISGIKHLGADLKIYDPWLPNHSTVKTLDEALDCKALVICTAHDAFTALNPELLKRKGIKVIIDGRNCLDKDKVKNVGIIYKGIGR